MAVLHELLSISAAHKFPRWDKHRGPEPVLIYGLVLRRHRQLILASGARLNSPQLCFTKFLQNNRHKGKFQHSNCKSNGKVLSHHGCRERDREEMDKLSGEIKSAEQGNEVCVRQQ
ncbi:hypothetical protein TcasGA2_TC000923 [Tribolium castaneum]|uniref:Uncharacterized protein n=1 Tax=Tribolium castaneum TaxID=7070 RepID=D6W941_TRICA|nr:hypothetical protein TcasGA2_TC000923 [Tribolium castaneum]